MDKEAIFQLAKEYRRHFHQWPELSEQEYQTQQYIAGILDREGVVYSKVGTGIVAQIGNKGKCVAIRAEMDALPVKEATGLAFASQNEGVMHACGHDMHLAMVLAVTVALKRQVTNGIVKVVFQPSEEKRPGGARLLLPELLKEPVPEAIFAQHVDPGLPVGMVGIRPGAFFASSDNIIAVVEGKGTHAAMPQNGSDPVLAVAVLIQFYQTLVTKYRNPLIPAVVTITSVHGGSANNVIPDRMEIRGTVRTHDNTLRNQIFRLIDEKSAVICALYGCEFKRDKTANGLPVLINDEKLTSCFRKWAIATLGENQVCAAAPLMLGEDFAIYLQHLPGILWTLGVCSSGQEMPPLHNPAFSPDERAMYTGIEMLLKCVEQVLQG